MHIGRVGCLVAAIAIVGGTVVGCSSNGSSTATSSTTASPSSVSGSGSATTASTSSGGSSATTDPTGTGAPGSAPCTSAAILDGVTAQDPSVASVATFRCDGQWAVATTSTATFLLEANGPRWSAVDRGTNCASAAIPADITSVACP